MARRKNLSQYRVVVSTSLPHNVELSDVRISQKIFELVKGYTIDGNTLIFERIADNAMLSKLVKIIESSGLSKFKVKPSYTVTQLSYSGSGKRLADHDVPAWTDVKAKHLLKSLTYHRATLMKGKAKDDTQWHMASEYQVTVVYPGQHYFAKGDEQVRRAMGRSDVSSGMGGERDLSFDFSRQNTMVEAIRRLKSDVPFQTKIYVARNVYDGRGYWEESIDVVKRSSADKALEKLKRAV